MRPARSAFARRWRRCVRVVTPADAAAMQTMEANDRRAWLIGLSYARLLRTHFRDFFLDHVATLPVTMGSMLGCAGAFLSLAHTHLIALDIDRREGVPIYLKDPVQSIREARYWNYTAKGYLTSGAKSWLSAPTPRMYGLGMETVAPDGRYGVVDQNGRVGMWTPPIEKHALALLIWRLLGDTRWAVLGETQAAELATARVGHIDLARAIATAWPLLRETPLRALCARLDQAPPPGLNNLGTIIAYVCRRTGNRYADASLAEAREHYEAIVDLDWSMPAAVFADQRNDQQAASQWSSAYSRLGTKLWKDHSLLPTLIDAIEQAALYVARIADGADSTPYDPRHLVNRLGGMA